MSCDAIDTLTAAGVSPCEMPASGNFQAELSLGIALQEKRQHADAIAALERAQTARPDDPMPFLHASLSYLALGRAEEALQAARAACGRAPQRPQAHSALGQALMALGKAGQAEKAFADALRYAPRSADLWVLCGVARFRQGSVEGATAAMREALRNAPGHAVAKDNLAALLRIAHKPAKSGLSAWAPEDPACALGVAVEFLSRMPAFGTLQFGEWSQVLLHQVRRGHFFFVVDEDRRVRGFLGWALTGHDLAEQWVEGRAGLRSEQCRDGDCLIINAFAAETAAARRFIIETMREKFVGARALYFKRHYPDGHSRAMRLNVNSFVADHIARARREKEDVLF